MYLDEDYRSCRECNGKDYFCKNYEAFSDDNDYCVLYKMREDEMGSTTKYYQKIGELEKMINEVSGWD